MNDLYLNHIELVIEAGFTHTRPRSNMGCFKSILKETDCSASRKGDRIVKMPKCVTDTKYEAWYMIR